MKKMSSIRIVLNLVLATLFAVCLTAFVAPQLAFSVGAIVFAGGLIPKQFMGFAFALQTEVWVEDIQETLFMNSAFIEMSVSHDAYVSNKIVHIPQSGNKPNVEVNRTQLPAVIAPRTDTDATYTLAEFSTDPILITNIDELQISYDKRKSVMNQNNMTLSEVVGNYVANAWAPSGSANYILTTGSSVATALPPSGTGNRKAVTLADIAALAAKLDKDNVPKEGRYLLMPTDMFWQLFTISEVVRASYNGFMASPSVVKSGVVAQILGFNIMERPVVNIFDNNIALKAVGAAGAATDAYGCLAWQRDYVAKALGAIKIFSDSGDNGEGKPEYYGILLSALVMLGSVILRSDNKGVVNLVQGT